MEYKLLNAFRDLFYGKSYLHRRSNLGDSVAMHLYEDLYSLGRSKRFVDRVNSGMSVLNAQNRRHGIKARRGDGTFGEIVPNVISLKDKGFVVGRGPIASIEIGVEVKILMKAMIKQIDRVISDLKGQAAHFRTRGGSPICVAVVGINQAPYCTTYEGERVFRTDGKKHKHPRSEAEEAEKRLLQYVEPAFDELLVLRFEATNEPPYNFSWANEKKTSLDYGAILARIASLYQNRT